MMSFLHIFSPAGDAWSLDAILAGAGSLEVLMNVQLLGAIMLTGLTTFVSPGSPSVIVPAHTGRVMTRTRSPWGAASALALSAVLAACNAEPTMTAAGAAPPPAQSAPAGAPAATAPEGGTFTGVVAETMDSGGYTYVRLEEGGRTVWAAALEFPVKTGERLTSARVAHGGIHQPDAQPHVPVISLRAWRA
jgi:hypothetical protein